MIEKLTDMQCLSDLPDSAAAARIKAVAAAYGDGAFVYCQRINGGITAVMGGMCASMLRDGKPVTVRLPVSAGVGFIALIPNFETETHAMREVLPGEVPFADAVFNASRLPALLRGFEEGDFALIGQALDDRLHQPYRKPLIHEYDRAESAALQAGCAAFCISGSGSTCLGVADAARSGEIAAEIQRRLDGSPWEWRVLALEVDGQGAICRAL